MKIVDILKDSALLLGLTQEAEVLDTVTEETVEQVLQDNTNIASLFNLIQYSIRELCTNFVPINIEQKISIVDKQYPIGELENFIRINNICKDGQMVKYKILNRNITLDVDGEYVINFASYPTINTMFDEIDFLKNYSPDVMVFGLCAYFSLAHGMFEEFDEFHDKYISKAESLKSLRIFEIPARRWE